MVTFGKQPIFFGNFFLVFLIFFFELRLSTISFLIEYRFMVMEDVKEAVKTTNCTKTALFSSEDCKLGM